MPLSFKQWFSEDAGEITSLDANTEQQGFTHLRSKTTSGQIKPKKKPSDPEPEALFGKMKKKMKKGNK